MLSTHRSFLALALSLALTIGCAKRGTPPVGNNIQQQQQQQQQQQNQNQNQNQNGNWQNGNNTNNQQNGIFYWGGNGQNITNAPAPQDQIQVYQPGQGNTNVPTIVALSAWRCEQMGDSVGQGDPDHDAIPDWDERFRWAEKCYSGSVPGLPNYVPWLVLGRNAVRADGTRLNLYPTFGSILPDGRAVSQRAPIESTADCNPAQWAPYVLIAFCAPGCFSPNQLIHASTQMGGSLATYRDSQNMEIQHAQKTKQSHVVTLAPGSSLDKMQFHSSATDYIRDLDAVDAKAQPYITLTMASGKSLQVTPDHPLVDDKGTMRAAKNLELGDSLLTAEGNGDKILKIKKEDLLIPAYNVTIKSNDPMQSLVIANGYVNGDLKFQRHDFEWLNRLLDRTNIPVEVVK